MFNIKKLSMIDINNNEYSYNFKEGINYFKGKNSSGKTVFYSFIDYMFGDSQNIKNKIWFKDSLQYSCLEFEYNGISYILKRTLDKDVNYFRYKEDKWGEPINLSEYKDKLNSVFTVDNQVLNYLREFTDENLTYRTFTVFNFLGEKTLGELNDFFTKSKDIKYSTKLPSILNFIFNNNLEEIFALKKQLRKLLNEVNQLEISLGKYEFIKHNINLNLTKLNISTQYNGKNKGLILQEIKKIRSLESQKRNNKQNKTISELETIYNNINEQIKIYENTIEDSKSFEIENVNKKKLINNLSNLLDTNKDYDYLIDPINKMIKDLDKRISFNKHVITNNTIKELKKQREEVRAAILANDARFSSYNVSEKSRSLALIEEFLNVDIATNLDDLENKKKKIRDIKAEIKKLQTNDDEEKIKELSNFITDLYKSGFEVSDIIKNDSDLDGFYIQYYKKGNLLQPKVSSSNSHKKDELENYYVGSMARHTLIQLCGYLGFLHLLLKRNNKYPIIPILVIDHISKPFDSGNGRAIGKIINEFYKKISVKEIQMLIFDDEDFTDLSITPDHHENLVTESKSGFNPFFHEKSNSN